MKKAETADICFTGGFSGKSRRGPFVLCRYVILALLSFLYCLPDISGNTEAGSYCSLKVCCSRHISQPDQQDAPDFFDDAPFLSGLTTGRQNCRRLKRTFSPELPDILFGNQSFIIAIQSNCRYFSKNSDHISSQRTQCLFVRAGPGIDA